MKAIIVTCRSKKHYFNNPTPAEVVYSAAYAFPPQRDFARSVYDEHYIISTKYGLIEFKTPIEYYDQVVFTQGKGHNKLKTKGIWDDNQKNEWGNQLKIDIEKLLGREEIESVDLHLTTSYWNIIKKDFENHPKVRFVGQQRNSPLVKKKYEEANKIFNGENLETCLSLISTISGEEVEVAKRFFHPEEGEIFGKARDVWKKFPYVDLGGLHRVSMGRANQHRGWVINETYLGKLMKKEGYKKYRLFK
tara:strand:- start:52 stop:795 length:744 start_codon:yes stop_codon:yes gene_type:complete